MNFSKADFPLIRTSAIATLASALLSGIIVYASQEFSDYAQTEFRKANNHLNEVRNRRNNALQDREYLETYSKDYESLQASNIIGDERRLDWMEELDKLRRQNLVIDFGYNISPQSIYSSLPTLDSGNLNINYSEMKLQFDLLHEEQLLNFLSAMQKQVPGHYQLQGCKMQLASTNNEDIEDNIPQASINIKAECTGGWITLKNRNAQS